MFNLLFLSLLYLRHIIHSIPIDGCLYMQLHMQMVHRLLLGIISEVIMLQWIMEKRKLF